jgi:hypothetical protein
LKIPHSTVQTVKTASIQDPDGVSTATGPWTSSEEFAVERLYCIGNDNSYLNGAIFSDELAFYLCGVVN